MEHNMRGFLSYLILWILRDKSMTGNEIAKELEKRKGTKPSPGTIYPALKELAEKGLISCDDDKVYTITAKGNENLGKACTIFCRMFYDIRDMFKCCK